MWVTVRELRNRTAQVVDAVRAGELVTLTSGGEPITAGRRPVSEATMTAFARLVHDCRAAGARPKILDALIAATAVEHGLPVVTQDAGFATMSAAHPPLEILAV
jgi:antitoxin (DNA-binding transcriptional repressor) of toxin-antitoxin stability system